MTIASTGKKSLAKYKHRYVYSHVTYLVLHVFFSRISLENAVVPKSLRRPH